MHTFRQGSEFFPRHSVVEKTASRVFPSADAFHVLKQTGCNKKLTQRSATKRRCALHFRNCHPDSRSKSILRLCKMLDGCWPCATVIRATLCWAVLYTAFTRKDRKGTRKSMEKAASTPVDLKDLLPMARVLVATQLSASMKPGLELDRLPPNVSRGKQ